MRKGATVIPGFFCLRAAKEPFRGAWLNKDSLHDPFPHSRKTEMLVLTRKPGEKVFIGDDIVVAVVEVTGNRVRIGIDAPDHVRILREELAVWREEAEGELRKYCQR